MEEPSAPNNNSLTSGTHQQPKSPPLNLVKIPAVITKQEEDEQYNPPYFTISIQLSTRNITS